MVLRPAGRFLYIGSKKRKKNEELSVQITICDGIQINIRNQKKGAAPRRRSLLVSVQPVVVTRTDSLPYNSSLREL